MKQTLTLLLGLTCLASQTHAKTIIVNVGDGGLVFKPDSVTAAPGDVVQFDYVQGNHSVAQSSFEKPCHPAPNGIYSGYMPAPANMSFAVTINDTNPIWYYCSQFGHCGIGAAMVGVINPPQNETVDAFINNAKTDTEVEQPAGIKGGVFIAATNNSSSNATASGGSSTTTSGSPTSSSSGSGTGTATSSAATASRSSGAEAVRATAAGGVGGLVALLAALLL